MTVKVMLARMRSIKAFEILFFIYIFQCVQSDDVKYVPLGYDKIQDRNCMQNDRDSQSKVKCLINILQN